ncbi:MAG: M23 family metallopeptidase [Treponema sp.]|nr:M23 family metallopeptidase [Treponema sp.]
MYRIEQVKQRPVRKRRSRKKRINLFFFNSKPPLFSRGVNTGAAEALRPGISERLYSRGPGKGFFDLLFKKKGPSGAVSPGIKGLPGPHRPNTPSGPSPLNSVPETPPLRSFLRTLLPLTVLLAVAAFFLFVIGLSFAAPEIPMLNPPPEKGILQDIDRHIGFLPDVSPEGAETVEDIPLDLTETLVWKSYKVKKGDSVEKIAENHGLHIDAIIAANGMSNANRVYEGQVLRLPNMDGIPYTVKRGDTLLKISAAMDIPLSAILDANDIESDAISQGTKLFIPGARMRTEDLKRALGYSFKYPVAGSLSSPFGWRNDPITGVRRHHAALDIAAPTGTPIRAAQDGRVFKVGFDQSFGKFIIINHGDGYQTLYAHMSATSAVAGSYVAQGKKIGEVGSTGRSTGPHLHFAIYKNGIAVNPLEFLK